MREPSDGILGCPAGPNLIRSLRMMDMIILAAGMDYPSERRLRCPLQVHSCPGVQEKIRPRPGPANLNIRLDRCGGGKLRWVEILVEWRGESA